MIGMKKIFFAAAALALFSLAPIFGQEQNAAAYKKLGLINVLPQDALKGNDLVAVIDDIITKRPPAPAYDRRTPERLAAELFDIAKMRHLSTESD